MTGFDPTAPDRDTSKDPDDEVPGNVVPPESLTEDGVPADGRPVEETPSTQAGEQQ